MLAEELLTSLQDGRKEVGKIPELPSIRAWKTRRPYALRGHLDMAEKRSRVVVSQAEQVAMRHQEALQGFFAARGANGPRPDHVDLPDGPLQFPLAETPAARA
jgi:hypothetical protein